MDFIAIFGFLGWFINRQEKRELYATRICMWCPQLVHWTGRVWVHQNGSQYISVPSRVEGVVPSVHPAVPDRSLMGVP